MTLLCLPFFTDHRSSLPLRFPHPSQLDKTGDLFYKCIERDIRSCQQHTHHEFSNIGLYGCTILSFEGCMRHNRRFTLPDGDAKIYDIVEGCLDKGLKRIMEPHSWLSNGKFVLQCYEDLIKEIKEIEAQSESTPTPLNVSSV